MGVHSGCEGLSGVKMAINCFRIHAGWLMMLASFILPSPLYAGEVENSINAGQKIFTYGLGGKRPACQKCHGPNALGLGSVDIATPRTASQVYTYLLKQLTDFATDRRTDDVMHQMNRIAKGLSEQ